MDRPREERNETPRAGWKTAFAAAAAIAAPSLFCRAAAAASAQTARKGFVRPRPSPWFSPLGEGGGIRCDLCPKTCRIEPGRRGACRVRENRGGTGYTLAYGNPVILQTDPIERKPFFHVLPGSRSLSVATAGCNFHCKFCQVWDMALVSPEEVYAHDVPPRDAVRFAREADARSMAYTFGEPIACFEYMLDIARLAREAGLLNLLHSNGFIQPEPLGELCGVLDGANIDLKGFDESFYRDVCGGELTPVLRTLERLRAAGVHLEITTLLIPTLNDGMETVRRMCRWIREALGADTPLHLARFYPLYRLANLPPTPVSTIDEARAVARDEGLSFVYVANVPGHAGEDTACPSCGNPLVERLGFVVERVGIEAGRCPGCARRVPGLWGDA